MNFIFSFIFNFVEMENHDDAKHIVLVNIDAKSRLWMLWTSLVMKHFIGCDRNPISDFIFSKSQCIRQATYICLCWNTKQSLAFVIFEN